MVPQQRSLSLRPYVSGQALNSKAAVRNLESPRLVLSDAAVEVVHVREQPELAEQDRILATPTLVRRQPEPVRKIIGDAMVLISGPTGTGKTLLVTQFIAHAAKEGKKAILFSFQESRGQLIRNAASWGLDLAGPEHEGLTKIIARYPERMSLEDLLAQTRADIEEFEPERIAVDSLTALERSATLRSFQEFVVALTGYVKQRQAAGVFTNTTAMLAGGQTATETRLSTTTDAILLLRYIEGQGTIKHGMLVPKMRGSNHEKGVREYTISNDGIQVGAHMPDATALLGFERRGLGGGVSYEAAAA